MQRQTTKFGAQCVHFEWFPAERSIVKGAPFVPSPCALPGTRTGVGKLNVYFGTTATGGHTPGFLKQKLIGTAMYSALAQAVASRSWVRWCSRAKMQHFVLNHCTSPSHHSVPLPGRTKRSKSSPLKVRPVFTARL